MDYATIIKTTKDLTFLTGVPAPVEGGVDYARKGKTTKDAKDTTKDKPVLQICPGLTHPDLPRLKCKFLMISQND